MLIVDLEPVFQAEAHFERSINRFDERVRKGAVDKTIDEAVREAINTHGYKDQTGLLTSRIKGFVEISVPGAAAGYFGAFTDYASFVNDGTRPHEIRGNPYLTFKAKDGTWVTTQVVQHPGTKGDGFITRAFYKAERVQLREVETAADQLNRDLDERFG